MSLSVSRSARIGARTGARIGIIGCGISGVAAAETLIRHGHSVHILDMGENPGGRLAVRDISGTGTAADGEVVDLGAAYFTASGPDFAARVDDWTERGLAKAWFDTCTVIDDAGSRRERGPMRFAATRGTRSLVVDLLEVLGATGRLELALATRVQQVRGADESAGRAATIDDAEFDAVILAMPDAQALRILDPASTAIISAMINGEPWQPVLSHIMVFEQRHWADNDFWFINNSPVVASVADNSRRRGSDSAVLVAHSTSQLARAHFDAPEQAANEMSAAVADALGFTARPVHTLTRRWGLAHPVQPRELACGWDEAARVAVCGDGWHGKPRIEAAWMSGKAAALEVLAAVGS